MTPPPPVDRRGFKIAVICALTIEADAVHDVFDVFWEARGRNYGQAEGDRNSYTTGVIGEHNVVLAHMPGAGKVSAATVAADLRSSFPNIELALVVGICGGVPNSRRHDKPIMLGDLIISKSVVQYDFGRRYPGQYKVKDTLYDNLGRSSIRLRGFMSRLETRRYRNQLQKDTVDILERIVKQDASKAYPGVSHDVLYEASYVHKHRSEDDGSFCYICSRRPHVTCETALSETCEYLGCEESHLVRHRPGVKNTDDVEPSSPSVRPPVIHFGAIGSADTVMKSGEHRDEIAEQQNVIAFEMEGAGVWDQFSSLIIKGVSDYADSHKKKGWQIHAATVAAAALGSFLKQWALAEGSSVLNNRPENSNPVLSAEHNVSVMDDPDRNMFEEISQPSSINNILDVEPVEHHSRDLDKTMLSEKEVNAPEIRPTCKLHVLRDGRHSRVTLVYLHGPDQNCLTAWKNPHTGLFSLPRYLHHVQTYTEVKRILSSDLRGQKSYPLNVRSEATFELHTLAFDYACNTTDIMQSRHGIAASIISQLNTSTAPESGPALFIFVATNDGVFIMDAILDQVREIASDKLRFRIAGLLFLMSRWLSYNLPNNPHHATSSSLGRSAQLWTDYLFAKRSMPIQSFFSISRDSVPYPLVAPQLCAIEQLQCRENEDINLHLHEDSKSYTIVRSAIDKLVDCALSYDTFSTVYPVSDKRPASLAKFETLWRFLSNGHDSRISADLILETFKLPIFDPMPSVSKAMNVLQMFLRTSQLYDNRSRLTRPTSHIILTENLALAFFYEVCREMQSGDPPGKPARWIERSVWEGYKRFNTWVPCCCNSPAPQCAAEYNLAFPEGIMRSRKDSGQSLETITASCKACSTWYDFDTGSLFVEFLWTTFYLQTLCILGRTMRRIS